MNSTKTKMCMACLAEGAPCADCALMGESPAVDASACLLCTHKHGAAFLSPCLQCAPNADVEGAVAECMDCLDTMKPLACNTTDPDQAHELGCWDSSSPTSVGACAMCVRHPDETHSGMCTACIHALPYTDTCQRCAVLEDACKQARCFQCIDASGHHPGSGCVDCLESLWEPAKQQRCLACLASAKLSVKAKEACYTCQEQCGSLEDATKCVQCLETEQDNYVNMCSCCVTCSAACAFW